MMMSGRCERKRKIALFALGTHSSVTQRSPWYPQQTAKLSQRATHNLNIHRLDLTTTLAPGHRPDPLYSSLLLLLLRTYVLSVYQKPISISQSRNKQIQNEKELNHLASAGGGALNFHSETIDPSSHEAPPCRFTYAGTCWWRVRYLRIDLIPTPKIQNDGTSDCCERWHTASSGYWLRFNSDWLYESQNRKNIQYKASLLLQSILCRVWCRFDHKVVAKKTMDRLFAVFFEGFLTFLIVFIDYVFLDCVFPFFHCVFMFVVQNLLQSFLWAYFWDISGYPCLFPRPCLQNSQ